MTPKGYGPLVHGVLALQRQPALLAGAQALLVEDALELGVGERNEREPFVPARKAVLR